jgi:hypothetical protein
MAEDSPKAVPAVSEPLVGQAAKTLASSDSTKNGDKTEKTPHWITVLLSGVAIVLSLVSYFESRDTRRLTEKLNRPIVRVQRAIESGPVLAKGEKTLILSRLVLKNTGPTFTKNVRIAIRSQLDDEREGSTFRKFSDEPDAETNQRSLGDLAPGDEDYVAFMAYVLTQPTTLKFGDVEYYPLRLKTEGTVTYENPLTGETYSEPVCYLLTPVSREFAHC